MLKDLARRVLPADLVDRPKGYFPVPPLVQLGPEAVDLLGDALRSPAARDRGLFRGDHVQHLLDHPQEHTPLRYNQLWELGVLELWLQSHRHRSTPSAPRTNRPNGRGIETFPKPTLPYSEQVSKFRIGITTSPTSHEGVAVEATNRSYLEGIIRAGAIPIVLPIVAPADVEAMLVGVDGIVLPGGGDIDPATYGAMRRLETEGVDADRDAFELAILRAAAVLSIPVLGICRGMQLINVAFGGTLVQHLPAVTAGEHRERERFAEVIHDIEVTPGSGLAEVLGAGTSLGVNTLHHQAVDQIGDGLQVVARATDDGIVEALESADGRVLGVQWHPELLPHLPGHAELFRWLVTACGPVQAIDRRTIEPMISSALPTGPAYIAAVDATTSTVVATVA